MSKKFSRLKWAVKANGGSFVEGDLKHFSDYYANNPELDDESDIRPQIAPVKVKSFYSGYVYETIVSKTAIAQAKDLIDLQVLNWTNGEAILHDQFIPAKIVITKIGDLVTKVSKITGWEYKTKIQGRYTYPIGQNNNQEMAIALENAENSAKQKNSNNLIAIEPERWI